MPWKMAAVILSLGLDNLVISTAIGTSHIRERLKYCLVFALFEGLMPIIGFVAGQSLAAWIGQWGFYIGVLSLLGLGIFFLLEDDLDEKKVSSSLKGWAIVIVAITISLDELAIGFSFGMLSFPLWITLILLSAQAFILTYIGISFGAKIRPYLGAWAGKATGTVLMATSVFLAIEHWFTV